MKAREAAKPAWAVDPPRKAPLILRYAYLRQHPQVFKVMTGLTVPLFDELCGDVRPRLAEAVYAERKMQVGVDAHSGDIIDVAQSVPSPTPGLC